MLRFRWKRLIIPAVFGGILLFSADDTLGQRGGGGPGGSGGIPGGGGGPGGGGPGGGSSRGGFTSDSSFDRLLQSYGGSGDTLDYSKVPPETRERNNRFAQMSGSPPMPTSGSISRAEYKVEFDKRMAAFQGGGRGMGGAPGAAPAPGGAAPAPGGVMVIGPGGTTGDGKTATVTMSTAPSGPGGPGGWGGGRGGEDADSRFREMDKNPDGKLTREEVQAGSRRLSPQFDTYDTNKDGSIDITEYRVYYAAATGGGGGGGNGWGGGGPGGGWGGQDPKAKMEEAEEPKPTVIRFGHLPQGLPSYFTEADFDKDGQIGLYEWVKHWKSTDEKLIEDFKALDTNGDGLMTAEEYMRVKKIPMTAAVSPGGPGRGAPPSYGTPAPPAPVQPTEGATPPSPGALPTDGVKKEEKPRDSGSKDQKKEEKRDSRPSGDSKQGDTRTSPGGPGGSRFPGGGGSRPTEGGGGGNPFNPSGRPPGK